MGVRRGFFRGVRGVHFCKISVKMTPTVADPSFDGEGASSSNYAQEVGLWRRATDLDVTGRASVLLEVDPGARDVCFAAGSDQLSGRAGVRKITQALRGYLAPDLLDSAYQDAARFPHLSSAAQTTGEYLARPDLLRRMVEDRA